MSVSFPRHTHERPSPEQLAYALDYADKYSPPGPTAHLAAEVRALLAERAALLAEDRCPSCEHRREFHSEPGCWYAVTTGTVGKPLNCPCTVVDWSAPQPAVPDGEDVPAVLQPFVPRRGDAVETWIKRERDSHPDTAGPHWQRLDDLLEDYRLRADTGTPLS